MSTDKLWRDYKDTEKLDLKNQLIENYIELVRIVAGRMYNFYGGKIEYDDLLGYGVLGLIDSIERFDIDKGVKFETYAQIRIRGEIIDNIRKQDWIPRNLRKRSKDIKDITYKLQNQLGRNPKREEIASELGITIEELEKNLSDMSSFHISSIESMLESRGDYILDIPEIGTQTPEDIYESKDIKSILVESIDELKDREKLIVSLYYYDELTYNEIGQILNLSESRISQIHSKAIKQMKNSLNSKGIFQGI